MSLERIIDNDDTYCEMLGFKNKNALEELYKDKVKTRKKSKSKKINRKIRKN